MRISIRFKLFISVFLVLVVFVSSALILNNTYLRSYYVKNQESSMQTAYLDLVRILDNQGVSEEKISALEDNYNIRINIFVDNEPRYSSIPQVKFSDIYPYYSTKVFGFGDNTFTFTPIGYFETLSISGMNTDVMCLFAMYGENTNPMYVMLSTSYASINSSIKVFNTYTIIISSILFIICTIIILITSSSFTKPIVKMNQVTKSIASLDFSKKVELKSNDEIGDLANNINKLSSDLEKTIESLKIANKQLEQDLELKNNIDNMRKEFISDVSHELKTPISLISGYSEALKFKDLNEDSINYYADIIIDESKKMNVMVNRLLKITQIDTGFVTLDKENFDIYDLIEQVLTNFSIKFKEKNIDVINTVNRTIVNADYEMIELVLSNYISNAINHIDENRKIKIFETGKDFLRINVTNTGKNIPEESLNLIWDSFYKVDKSRTREYGGTGLGLSIVKSIMKTYNHEYGVENLVDGVNFYFELDYAK